MREKKFWEEAFSPHGPDYYIGYSMFARLLFPLLSGCLGCFNSFGGCLDCAEKEGGKLFCSQRKKTLPCVSAATDKNNKKENNMGAQGSTFQIGYADFFRENEMFMVMLWIEVQDIYLWRLHWTP